MDRMTERFSPADEEEYGRYTALGIVLILVVGALSIAGIFGAVATIKALLSFILAIVCV